jgi:hypothetical protein
MIAPATPSDLDTLKLLFYERDSRSCRASLQPGFSFSRNFLFSNLKALYRRRRQRPWFADARIKLDTVIFLCRRNLSDVPRRNALFRARTGGWRRKKKKKEKSGKKE